MGVQQLWTIRPYLHVYDELIDQGAEHLHQADGVNSGDFISSPILCGGFNQCFWESLYSSWNSGPYEPRGKNPQKYHLGVKAGQKCIPKFFVLWSINLSHFFAYRGHKP